MPEKKHLDVPVSQLQKGDVILKVKDLRVVTFEGFGIRKPVNWTLDLVAADGTTRYSVAVRKYDPMSVERMVPTEEELAAERLAYAMKSLRSMYNSWRTGAVDRLGKIVDAARETEDHYPELLNYSSLASILQDQAKAKIMYDVKAVYQRDREAWASFTDDEKLVNAFALVYIDVTRTRSYNDDPLSRSTSVLSNICEDVDKWAKREFAYELTDGFRGYAIRELIMARVEEIKAENEEIKVKNGYY